MKRTVKMKVAQYMIVAVLLNSLFSNGIPNIPLGLGMTSMASEATPSNAEKNTEQVFIATDSDAIKWDDLDEIVLTNDLIISDAISDDIAVQIPASVTLNGDATEASFELTVSGYLDVDTTVWFDTGQGFQLQTSGKEPINGNIELSDCCVTSDDLVDGQAVLNGTVKLDKNITAGAWEGNIAIAVNMDSPTLETLESETMEEVEVATSSNASRQ